MEFLFSTIVRQGVQSTLIVPVGIGPTALRNVKSAPSIERSISIAGTPACLMWASFARRRSGPSRDYA